jgi:hypothetical protein
MIVYQNAAIVKKDYERLDLIIVYLWNFACVKKNPWKKISRQKFSIFFKLWSSYQMFLAHLLVHYAIIIMKIVIFLKCKMFFLWRCRWVECCFYYFT